MPDSTDVIKSLIENAPIKDAYVDTVQPTARLVGKSLETVAGLVNASFAPLRVLSHRINAWEVREHLNIELADRLKYVPIDRIVQPKALLAAQAIDGAMFTEDQPSLQAIYLNLLATAMDSETAKYAHPSFPEVIKQITPDEARIINYFCDSTHKQPIVQGTISVAPYHEYGRRWSDSLAAKQADCENVDLSLTYLANLVRLGIFEVTSATNSLLLGYTGAKPETSTSASGAPGNAADIELEPVAFYCASNQPENQFAQPYLLEDTAMELIQYIPGCFDAVVNALPHFQGAPMLNRSPETGFLCSIHREALYPSAYGLQFFSACSQH